MCGVHFSRIKFRRGTASVCCCAWFVSASQSPLSPFLLFIVPFFSSSTFAFFTEHVRLKSQLAHVPLRHTDLSPSFGMCPLFLSAVPASVYSLVIFEVFLNVPRARPALPVPLEPFLLLSYPPSSPNERAGCVPRPAWILSPVASCVRLQSLSPSDVSVSKIVWMKRVPPNFCLE